MRIVVTGMGLVCPLGRGVGAVWKKLIAGESGIRRVRSFNDSSFNLEDFSSQVAGQIPEDVSFDSFMSEKEQRKVGRFITLSVIAADEAIAQARWFPNDPLSCERTGVLVGSGIGGLPEIEHSSIVLKTQGPRRISPFFVPSALINLSSGYLSIRYGLRGPNLAIVTACSSGAHAIGEGAKLIRGGQADIVIAGGTEAAVCPLGLAGFSAMKALSTRFNTTPEEASRPWDKDRDGFVIAEGSGVVVLESLEHALKRNASIYGELVGYGLSGDAYHIAAPREDGEGALLSMKMALKQAGLLPEEIGYINAHATSTVPGDRGELRALEQLFPPGTKVSSTKSSMGHTLGAAGSIEAILSLMALNTGFLPPTLNLFNSESTSLNLLPHTCQEDPSLTTVLSNSFGFGGTNSTLIFKKYT